MRIEGPNRSSGISSRGAVGKAGSGPAFVPAGTDGPTRPAAAAPAAPAAALDAILALQGVGTSTEGRRRAVRRGQTLLDMLEEIKADLLIGSVNPKRLDALVVQLGGLRERGDAGLDALIDDIELRVRVELAKFGRFPAS